MTEASIDDRILTVEEVANFLQLSEATIYKMAQDGKIPAKRVGRSWRFSQAQRSGQEERRWNREDEKPLLNSRSK